MTLSTRTSRTRGALRALPIRWHYDGSLKADAHAAGGFLVKTGSLQAKWNHTSRCRHAIIQLSIFRITTRHKIIVSPICIQPLDHIVYIHDIALCDLRDVHWILCLSVVLSGQDTRQGQADSRRGQVHADEADPSTHRGPRGAWAGPRRIHVQVSDYTGK